MTSTSSGGNSVIMLQFSSQPEHRRRRSRSAGGHQRVAELPAGEPAHAADLQQDQSCRRADSDACASPRTTMPLSQVEDLADTRLAQKISQLSGVGLVSISGGQKPAVRIQVESYGAGLLRPQPGRPAHRAAQRQRQRGQGQLRRPAAGLPDRRQRSAAHAARTTATSSSRIATARR